MKGKPLYNTLVNRFFTVKDVDNNNIAGEEKRIEVAKSIVELDDQYLPQDIKDLKEIITSLFLKY